MEVVTLVRVGLVYFHLDAMRVSPGVLTDAGDLPGNLHSRLAGLDRETAVGDFRRDPGLRGLSNRGELIPEIGIERIEPCGHSDDRCATAVGDDVAVVYVHHVGRFDEGVVEILVRWIKRVIDFEGAAGFAQTTVNV